MKKYQQLLLAILSVVSFSCLLIYRHEYNKLRYVLEVLNFFGTPGGSTAAPLLCKQNVTTKQLSASPQSIDPLPAWQRISNSLYIYSAYWEKVDEKEQVVALAVGVLNENLNYGCYLHYDTTPRSKLGQFNFSGLPYKNLGKSRTKGFLFYCEAENNGAAPVGVVFFKTSVNESSQGFLPVFNLQSNTLLSHSIGICILPAQFFSYNKANYLEFLSFHKVIGVSKFIIYGGNDQYNLLSSIQQNPNYELDLTVLHWNYPYFGEIELEKIIAENDCKMRSIGLLKNVLILEWNKFFVPTSLDNVSGIINKLDPHEKTFKFQFSTLLFCNEYEDNKKTNKSTPHILRKTRYAFPKTDILVSIYRPILRIGRVQRVKRNIAAVQLYASCRDFRIKSGEKKVEKTDTSIYKFKDKFLNSQLLRL